MISPRRTTNRFSGAFGDVALRIQHDRFVESEADRLGLGQNRVRVVAGDLRFRHVDVRVQPRERGHVRPNALLDRFCAEVVLPRPDRDTDVRLAGVHRQVPAAFRQMNQRTDVTRRGRSCGRCLWPRPPVRRLMRRSAEAKDERRVDEPAHVVAKAEDRRPCAVSYARRPSNTAIP